MEGNQLLLALASAALGVVSTMVTVLYGPAWRQRTERRREREARSEFLIAHYSEPLARAAFDLHSRLVNVVRNRVLEHAHESRDLGPYLETSTLWLIGQLLGWMEIFRRDVQLQEMGDVSRTAALQQCLFDIATAFSSRTRSRPGDDVLVIRRADQRAIGELMVVERQVANGVRPDCMGYAQFVYRLQDDERFAAWFDTLRQDLGSLARGEGAHERPIHLQQALIDLVTFLDPRAVRFTERRDRLALSSDEAGAGPAGAPAAGPVPRGRRPRGRR